MSSRTFHIFPDIFSMSARCPRLWSFFPILSLVPRVSFVTAVGINATVDIKNPRNFEVTRLLWSLRENMQEAIATIAQRMYSLAWNIAIVLFREPSPYPNDPWPQNVRTILSQIFPTPLTPPPTPNDSPSPTVDDNAILPDLPATTEESDESEDDLEQQEATMAAPHHPNYEELSWTPTPSEMALYRDDPNGLLKRVFLETSSVAATEDAPIQDQKSTVVGEALSEEVDESGSLENRDSERTAQPALGGIEQFPAAESRRRRWSVPDVGKLLHKTKKFGKKVRAASRDGFVRRRRGDGEEL